MKDELKTDLENIAIDKLPVGCLAGASFRIPKYQRGYRWKTDDVTKLLKDLMEFIDEEKNETKETEEKEKSEEKARRFYCLQPLVVKKSEEHPSEWEVVDGQQRLTTLFLIWNVLNGQPPYRLSYATRDQSEEFLKNPVPPSQEKNKHRNIDFHHIYLAHKTIQDWFKSGNEEEKKKQFLDLLKNTEPNGPNVRFIWYQLQEDDDAVAAFTRLNVGKIPLNDEELIRALFLRSREAGKPADGAFQHRLALEWNRIETALQEPDFWGFLSNEQPPEGGRIRLIFQLCATTEIKADNHALFDYYHDRLNGDHRKMPSTVWDEIIAYFEQLEEWYRDPELYHLVGYRTTVLNQNQRPTDILRDLLQKAKASTKQDFARNLRVKIRTELITGGKELSDFIDELDYQKNQDPIRPTLALFNIAAILRTEGVRIRFPFHLYHDTKVGWDIEHVHSQAGDGLKDKSRWKEWIPECIPELQWEAGLNTTQKDKEDVHEDDQTTAAPTKPTPGELLAEIEAFTKQETEAEFTKLMARIRDYFGESHTDERLLQSIGNLTLLDAPTNRSYGNAPFVVKRTEILKPERPEGTFILPCTRDLFLKVFSKDPGNLRRWDVEKDGADHEKEICKTLDTFFAEKGGIKS